MAGLLRMIMPEILTYTELLKRNTYGDRLDYLKLWNKPHTSPRNISNSFYKSRAWKLVRDEVMARDLRCDLGVTGMFIDGQIIVHHMNPLQPEDIEDWTEDMLDPEYLICVSEETHNRIHYNVMEDIPERSPGDTKLW